MNATEMALAVRKQFGDGDEIRDAGLTTPDDVERFDGIIYGDVDKNWQSLDVYRPKNKEGQLPVIVSIHGGGWVYGDKERYQFYTMSLAQRGFAVVNFSYRLAPEYIYPASFEDCSAVCTWMQANAEKYGFDMDHVFGVGDSAGAHMLSVFAGALTSDKPVPYKLPENFSFKAIALNCGVYDFANHDLGSTEGLMEALFGKVPDEEDYDEITAVNYVTEKYPPCFIMTCPGDFLFHAPEVLVKALKENKVPFFYHVYGNAEKPLAHVFHVNMKEAEGKVCNDDECAFFARFC